MSYSGFGGTEEVDRFNEAVTKSVEGGGRVERLKAAGIVMTTRTIDQMVEKFSKTDAGKVVKNSAEAAGHLHAAIKQIKDGKMDAAGIANVAASGFAMMNNIIGVIAVGDSATAAEISKWSNTVVNCAVGVASTGPMGALSCSLQVLSNVLDYITGSAPKRAAWDTPRTLFRPNEITTPLIAADAARLASVLKYYYGVDAYRPLYNRLLAVPEFRPLVGYDDAGLYPNRPMTTPQGKVVASDKKAIPGHNLRTILQLMYIGKGASDAHVSTRDTLAAIAGWRHGGLEPSGRGLFRRYEWDQDVNHHAIATAAYWGRMAIAAGGDPRVKASMKASSDLGGWRIMPIGGDVRTIEINTRPFIIVDELINFFAGVTRREIDVGGPKAALDLSTQYGIGQHNPTQHLYVKVTDRSGEPPNGASYSEVCWTNLKRSTGQACDLQNKIGPGVGGDVLRDVGAIRLMAAFSFLHQTYLWGHPVEVERDKRDPIRTIPRTGTVIDELQAPVDPRGVLGNKLHQAEQAPTEGRRVDALARAATTIHWRTVEYHQVLGTRGEGQLANSSRWNPDVGYARGVMVGEWLAKKIAQEQTALKQVLTASATAPTRDPSTFVDWETVQRARAQAAAVSSGLSPFQLLVKPIDLVDVHGRSVGRGSNLAVPLIAGAAALLALKFLK